MSSKIKTLSGKTWEWTPNFIVVAPLFPDSTQPVVVGQFVSYGGAEWFIKAALADPTLNFDPGYKIERIA